MRFLRELMEMAAGNFRNRKWYHGTSQRNYKKILASKFLIPFLSDDEAFGKAIWFTSDLEEAKELGDVVLSIRDEDLKKFRNKKISEYPHGMKKREGIRGPQEYHLVVLDKIPLKLLKLVK